MPGRQPDPTIIARRIAADLDRLVALARDGAEARATLAELRRAFANGKAPSVAASGPAEDERFEDG